MSVRVPSDLAELLKDAGEVATYNGGTLSGILSRTDGLEFPDDGAPIQKRFTTLLVETGAADFRDEGLIVVAGTRYRIDQISPQDDGALTLLTLARAT